MSLRKLLFAATILGAECSFAQPVPIDQAVKEATEKNVNLIAERMNIPIAEARIITAKLRPNPVLSLGADYLDVLGTGFTKENQAGPSEGNARVDFLFERGKKREYRTEVAQLNRSVAELNVLNTMRGIMLDVENAYLDVLAATESVALANENLKALGEIVSVNTERVRTGDLARVELLRSRLAALQYRNQARQAELRLRSAQHKLKQLMGRPATSPDIDVTGPMRRDPEAKPLEAILDTAGKLRPDLNALVRDQARSAADIRLQIAQGKVDYTAGAQVHRQQSVNGTGSSLGLFLSMPLPVFNRNQGEIERARLEHEQLSLRIKALQTSIGTEVQTAYEQYRTSRAMLESIEKEMLQQARDVRSTTEYSYRRGEASLLEFLDAQRAFNDTIQSYNDARADYARSLYQLDSVSGEAVNR